MRASLLLFCLTLDYTKILIPTFLENGFKVSSRLTTNKLGNSKGISNYIAVNLERENLSNIESLGDEIRSILDICKIYYYGFNISLLGTDRIYLGNIDGETDITRVMKMKALW